VRALAYVALAAWIVALVAVGLGYVVARVGKGEQE